MTNPPQGAEGSPLPPVFPGAAAPAPAPAPAAPPPAPPVASPASPPADTAASPETVLPDLPPEGPRTQNDRLHDGVNRCPRCGSTEVQLRPETGELICLFCRYQWSEAKIEDELGLGEGIDSLSGTVIASGAKDIDRGADLLRTFKCGGCGAEVIINTATEMTARCHWCRHILTVNEQVPNGAVPDAVMPFSITHEQAVAKIREFANGRKFFAHRQFVKDFSPENVVGVYMPYMVVDANAAADMVGRGEVETARYTRGSSENRRTYYDADVYQVHRHAEFIVDDLTIESSGQRADQNVRTNTNNIINAVLPFDTKNAVEWNAAYLINFTSETRDQNVEEMQPRVRDQLLSIARSQVEPTIRGYDRGVRWEGEKLDLHGTRWVSMSLPIWLYSYYHVENGRGMVHYIAVNGRTGKTMGSIPLATGKLTLFSVLIAAGITIPVLAFLGFAVLA